ncbi:unnamed protein product [Lactuca saligna]|uniref:Alpha-1,3-glucosyltransferase n=1 Tax=Lactuca saligna TaxID=75948 RepID=A0AA35YKH1_LACSI|nr:unnamed protein product [Lactuca saligna]
MKPTKQKKPQQSKEKQTHLQNPHEPTNTIIKDLLWFSLIITFFKLLLIPAYHSTDFEVHRNWLALTHTLPLSQWYTDETSPWTLDYPPFFAYFEYLLSHFASLVDPTITNLYNGLNYKSPSVIIFQRLTVIASDSILIYSIYKLTKTLNSKKRFLIWISVISSPGLLIVDHIHFQYNGFLLGLLMASLGALQNGHDLTGGLIFAILLCFKHLFAVAGPVYFVYILRHYCRGGFLRGLSKLITMGVVVIAVFVTAYGPFAYHGQIQDVLKRMFPFGRGLCHAYWAPNFWVFYILSDKLLAFVFTKLGFYIKTPTASFTGGLVGDSSPFAILPTVTPSVTFGVVLLAILPCVVKIWRNPDPKKIVRWVAYAYTCGFLFGWHVHEKASLHFLIPLAVVAVESIQDARHYFMLSIGNTSNYYIGIWYKKIKSNPLSIVWVANRETPISDRFRSELKTIDGNLVLLNESKSQIWSTNVTTTTTTTLNSATAVILDNGNLVLRDSGSNSIEPFWQSFDHPTHTWLPGAKLGYDNRTKQSQIIRSWRSNDDPAVGLFSVELHPPGKEYVSKWNGFQQYWTSGAWDGEAFYLVPETRLDYNYIYSYHENVNESYFIYSVQSGLPFCNCLTGFNPRSESDWNQSDFSSGCVRKTDLQCGRNMEKQDFLKIRVKNLPPNNSVAVGSAGECRTTCLNDCLCNAYSSVGTQCLVWDGDLLNLSEDDGSANTIYIKVASKDLPRPKKSNNLIVVVGVVGGVVLFLVVVLILIYRKKRVSLSVGKTTMEGTQQFLIIEELIILKILAITGNGGCERDG